MATRHHVRDRTLDDPQRPVTWCLAQLLDERFDPTLVVADPL
jgi:hypothetical protein